MTRPRKPARQPEHAPDIEMPEPIVDPTWSPPPLLSPDERAKTRRNEQKQPKWDQAEIETALAKSHSGRALLQALTCTYHGDAPRSDTPPQWFLKPVIEVVQLVAQWAQRWGWNRAEQMAVLRAALASIEEELGLGPALEPPSTAPHRWAAREAGKNNNPAQFTRQVYRRWLGKGLTRRVLNDLDPELYRALAVWEHRHPEDRLTELPTVSEVIDRQIAALSLVLSRDELLKLASTLQSRKRRVKK